MSTIDEIEERHRNIAAPYVVAERERCARIAEACVKGVAIIVEGKYLMMYDHAGTAKAIAAAIRCS
jgi:hypothetical protein